MAENGYSPLQAKALRYIENGISVIVTRENKRPLGKWSQYQQQIIEADTLKWQLQDINAQGIATIGGKVSGGLEIIDFDQSGVKYKPFMQRLKSERPELVKAFYIIKTPSNGYHLRYRYDAESYDGNLKLAHRYKTDPNTGELALDDNGDPIKEVLIETRGEGGYALDAPSPGYIVIQDVPIPTISKSDRDYLIQLAKSFDESPQPEYTKPTTQQTNTRNGESPGDAFEAWARQNWQQFLLGELGFTLTELKHDRAFLARPGKAPKDGHSAVYAIQTFSESTGTVTEGHLYNFSTNTKGLEEKQSYSMFGLLAYMRFNGDFKAAAKEAVRRDFGEQKQPPPGEQQSAPNPEQAETERQAGEPPPDHVATIRSAMGIYEGDGYYYKYIKQDDDYVEKPISSFIIRPQLRVEIDGKEDVVADFVTANKNYENEVIHRDDWTTVERFKKALPFIDLTFHGTSNDVQSVQGIVAQYDVPTKHGTQQLGYHESGVWMLSDSVLTQEGRVESGDLVYLPEGGRGELDSRVYIPSLDDTQYQSLVENLYGSLLFVNHPHVTFPVISWFMATPFKPQFNAKFEGFPLLSVAGTRGAGKSTFLRLMWRIMGMKISNSGQLFSCTETDFVMLKLLSSTTSIPLIFDEYKPYDLPQRRLKAFTRLLRRAYDGETESRGKPDRTTVAYSLTAPVAVAGEVPLTEGALLERIIPVKMSPNILTSDMRKAYQMLRYLPLQAFCSRYIPFCLRTNFDKELSRANATAIDFGLDDLPDRVRNNLIVMIFGFNQFIRFGVEQGILDANDNFSDLLRDAVYEVKAHVCGQDGITRVALDYLIEHLAIMAETGRLKLNRDYTIRDSYGDIAIRFGGCFAEYRKYHRETQLDGEILNDSAYRAQVNESYDRDEGYITAKNVNVKFGSTQKKATFIIDPDKAEAIGLDVSGFFGNDETED